MGFGVQVFWGFGLNLLGLRAQSLGFRVSGFGFRVRWFMMLRVWERAIGSSAAGRIRVSRSCSGFGV